MAKRTRAPIPVRKEGKVTVKQGWKFNEFFGAWKPYKHWMLTHLPTGMAVAGKPFRTLEDAGRAANFLAQVDWSFWYGDDVPEECFKLREDCEKHLLYSTTFSCFVWKETASDNVEDA